MKKIAISKADLKPLAAYLNAITGKLTTIQNVYGRHTKYQISSDNVKIYFRSENKVSTNGELQSVLTIGNISIEPVYKGIGTKVMEWFIQLAKEKGFQFVLLENCHSDGSIALARKFHMDTLWKIEVPGTSLVSYEHDYGLKLTN